MDAASSCGFNTGVKKNKTTLTLLSLKPNFTLKKKEKCFIHVICIPVQVSWRARFNKLKEKNQTCVSKNNIRQRKRKEGGTGVTKKRGSFDRLRKRWCHFLIHYNCDESEAAAVLRSAGHWKHIHFLCFIQTRGQRGRWCRKPWRRKRKYVLWSWFCFPILFFLFFKCLICIYCFILWLIMSCFCYLYVITYFSFLNFLICFCFSMELCITSDQYTVFPKVKILLC